MHEGTSTASAMLNGYPRDLGRIDRQVLVRCIEVLIEASQACTACADACLSEDDVVELAKCVRTNLDCADVCAATSCVLSRHTGYDFNVTRALLEACSTVCFTCADECARHAERHHHCYLCAQV